MYNLLVLIPNYGNHQKIYLKELLKEYDSFNKIKVKIILFSTEDLDLSEYSSDISNIIFNVNIGAKLTQMPREYAFEELKKINNFDIFMHQENDTLITEKNILTFIEGQSRFKSEQLIHGFLRYEEFDGEKYLIDMHKNDYHSIGKFEGDRLIVDNVHQGGWILAKNQLIELKNRNLNYKSSLEDNCSNFYKSYKWPGLQNGLEKYIFKDLIKNSLIYHLPNKYISIDKNFLSITELIK